MGWGKILLAAVLIAAPTCPASASIVDGRWMGTMLQTDVTGQTSYKILLELDGDHGRSVYPELRCAAELLAVATVNGYTIYSETVTEGRIDPDSGVGCIDGFLVVQPEKDMLTVEWVGNHLGQPYMAMSVLEPVPSGQ